MIEGRLTEADLAQLPAPKIVETLNYEEIVSSCKEDLQAVLDQDYPALGVQVRELPESDPLSKILEILSYRELHMRQRINETTRDCLLSSATGDGMQNLASWLIGRQDELPEVMRRRVLEEFDAYHTAGTPAAYRHFAAAVAPDQIKDVHVAASQAEVNVTLLPHNADMADRAQRADENQQLVAAVQATLAQDTIRPIGHWVKVKMATLHRYRVKARLGVRDMPGIGEVAQASRNAVIRYTGAQYSLGKPVLESALLAAVFQPGVKYAILDEPQADLRVAADAAAFCAADDVLVTINDRVSEERVKGVTLTNTSSDPDRLSGLLEITPPEHEVRLEYYGVYWADAEGRRLEGYSSITELRAGGDRRYTFHDVAVPAEAAQLVVHTANENGEMAQGFATRIAS